MCVWMYTFQRVGKCGESIAQACFHLKPSRWFDPHLLEFRPMVANIGDEPLTPLCGLPASLFAGFASLGAPRRLHLGVVFLHFPLPLSLLSGSLTASLSRQGEGCFSRTSRTRSHCGALQPLPRSAGLAGGLRRSGMGPSCWDDPPKGAGLRDRDGRPGCAPASAWFALRAGGVASEQQASRSVKTAS